ncbi:MAG: ABC transporter permease [Fulvivirga sp.]
MLRKLVNWVLLNYCNQRLYEAISGDLEELYDLDVQKHGFRKANRSYLVNSISFLRYHRLRKGKTTKTNNNMSLIKNYVKVSWRDLLRHKTYTSINLIGLVSAMTVSLMILQYVVYETGFDQFHGDYDRIFRVVNDRYQKGELIQHGTITYPTVGPTMAKDFPEIEAYTRMTFNSRNYIGFEDDLHLTEQFIFADEHFLNFFSFKLLHGDPNTALDAPFEAVLSESFARRILESDRDVQEMVGKNIEIYSTPTKITGIVADAPDQSHLQYDMLLSYKTFVDLSDGGADTSWDWSDFYHYVKLKEQTSLEGLTPKLEEFGVKYFKDGEVSGSVEKFHLQPLAETHLDISMQYEFGRVVNGKIVWTLLIISGFILLIAWINFINLTTSRALQRAKEVGVRKSIGANRSHVVFQFVVETLMVNALALAVSLAAVWLLQPFFNQLTGLQLDLVVLWVSRLFGIPFPVLFLIVFIFSLIVISLYPATLLAGFRAKDVINGKYKMKGRVAWLRKGLVIFQFITAIALINGAVAISDQVDYMLTKDLGLDIDNTLVVYGPAQTDWDSTFFSKVDRFQNEVKNLAAVNEVSTSNRIAGSRMGKLFQVRNNAKPDAENLSLNWMGIGYNFEQLYGLELLEGRTLEPTDYNYNFGRDRIYNLLINRAAVEYLGFNSVSEAIGGVLTIYRRQWRIVGVVEDFHQMTLHDKIEPMALQPFRDTADNYSIKLEGGANDLLLADIERLYNTIFPGNYFDYFFLTDTYRRYYQPEIRLRAISKAFTILSIIMVILGLYGLTTMTLEKKVKEIGIRKVLGARVTQLLLYLTKDFALLMLIAMILGVPLSLYFIGLWKADFAYSSPLGVGSVAMACLLILVFTSIPILLQTRRVASNNPVQALRDE